VLPGILPCAGPAPSTIEALKIAAAPMKPAAIAVRATEIDIVSS
jgi:hypothetical protein